MYYAPWLGWSTLCFILLIITVVLNSVKMGYMQGTGGYHRGGADDDTTPIVVAVVSITSMILFVVLNVYCIFSVYRLFRVVKEEQQVNTFTD